MWSCADRSPSGARGPILPNGAQPHQLGTVQSPWRLTAMNVVPTPLQIQGSVKLREESDEKPSDFLVHAAS